ncbi:MAG TPA: transcription antitermination factor NusB [Bryobacteraceae bacterium]|nr:transcription antitermination factor NusB [Bryobacteraceae bacterium]
MQANRKQVSAARALAFDILLAVERGGYAADLLAARSAGLDSRDAGLAEEIVLGVLRRQSQLDFLIQHYSGRTRMDPEVRLVLRMGIYQLRYLDRIPPHAAVGESVELVGRARKRSAMGFANAVLRKVDRAPVAWPDRATALSHPAWLLERWERQFGAAGAEAIALANLRAPEKYVRVPPGGDAAGLEATEVPGCYRVPAGAAPAGRAWRWQDIGSQWVVPHLRLAPGQRLLDLCAAPGNKTAQALETGVAAVACDLHPHRLAGLRRLDIPLVVLDGTRPLPFGRCFDRILLDAPCSGTGTLARNPEIKWRLRPEDLADLAGRQKALLEQARAWLAPDGILVYSTCSLEPEENEEVIATVPGERVLEKARRIPGRDAGDGFFAAVIK